MALADAPRSIRTNNPGALNYGPFAQRYGATGSDGRLAIFPDVETGRRAQSALLDTYERQHGLNTVSGIINRWAPRNVDNNSTDLYIKTVASKLGVDPNAPLTAQHRPALMDAMAAYEAGTSKIPTSGSYLSPGLSGAAPPMALSNAYPPQMPEQGYLDKVVNSPLFMMGASVLGAPNIGTGLMQGAQASQAAQMGSLKMAQFRDAQASRDRQRQMWDAVTSGSHPLLSGVPLEMRQALSVMDPETGMKTLQNFALTNHANAQKRSDPMYQAQLAQTQAHTRLYDAQANTKQDPLAEFNNRELVADRLGLVGDARTSFVATGKMGREVDAQSLKYIYQAQDDLPNLDSAIAQLEEAKGLVHKAYSGGIAPVTASKLNQALPDWMPDIMTDRDRAKATLRYDQLMSGQAVEAMSAALKGATTDTELKLFKEMMADPRIPPENKVKMIEGMLKKAHNHRQILDARIRELGGNRPSSRAATGGGDNGGGSPRDNDPLGIR